MLPPAGKTVPFQDKNQPGRFKAGSDTELNWLDLTNKIITAKPQKNLLVGVFIYALQRLCAALPHVGLQPAPSPRPPAVGQWESKTVGHPQPLSAGAELSPSSLCCSAPALGQVSALLQVTAVLLAEGKDWEGTATAVFASIASKYERQMKFQALLW